MLTRFAIACLLPLLALIACGENDERRPPGEKSKVERAVEEAVTKEFKILQGAKRTLEKIERDTQERREKETEVQ
jgi:hypothetical protein